MAQNQGQENYIERIDEPLVVSEFANPSSTLEGYQRNESNMGTPIPDKNELDMNSEKSPKESLSWNDYRWRQNGKKKRKTESGWIIRLYYDCASRTKTGCKAKLKIEKKGTTETYQIYGDVHNHPPPTKPSTNRLVNTQKLNKASIEDLDTSNKSEGLTLSPGTSHHMTSSSPHSSKYSDDAFAIFETEDGKKNAKIKLRHLNEDLLEKHFNLKRVTLVDDRGFLLSSLDEVKDQKKYIVCGVEEPKEDQMMEKLKSELKRFAETIENLQYENPHLTIPNPAANVNVNKS